MANISNLMSGVADLLWVVFAFVAVLILRAILTAHGGPLTRLGLGPTGVTMEFAETKLDEAANKSGEPARRVVGDAARRSVIDRLQRHDQLLGRARVLWVDDHPENNLPIVQLLRRFGASVDTPQSNAEALELLRGNRYDVVISDVARDSEGPDSDLKGVKLAQQVFDGWGLRTILFTARFNPATLPDRTEAKRLELVTQLQRSVFATTNRMDEALHYILDVLER